MRKADPTASNQSVPYSEPDDPAQAEIINRFVPPQPMNKVFVPPQATGWVFVPPQEKSRAFVPPQAMSKAFVSPQQARGGVFVPVQLMPAPACTARTRASSGRAMAILVKVFMFCFLLGRSLADACPRSVAPGSGVKPAPDGGISTYGRWWAGLSTRIPGLCL